MSLVRYYSPELHRLRRSLFDNTSFPATDIIEVEDEYIVKVNLPGFSKDDITIEVDFESLKIVAEKEEDKEKDSENNQTVFLHRERVERKFMRSIAFNKPVNAKDATTALENGVLTIIIPKSEESKPVKLKIN